MADENEIRYDPARLNPSIFVYFPPVTDFDHEYEQPVLLDAADQAVVSHTVAPKTGQILSQRLAKLPRIFRAGDAFAQVAEDGLLRGDAQFAQLAAGAVVKFYRPLLDLRWITWRGQVLAPTPLMSNV